MCLSWSGSSAATSWGSCSSITKSASLPILMLPLMSSSKEAQALWMVPILSAWSTVTIWFPPQTRPWVSLRVTMAWSAIMGS